MELKVIETINRILTFTRYVDVNEIKAYFQVKNRILQPEVQKHDLGQDLERDLLTLIHRK